MPLTELLGLAAEREPQAREHQMLSAMLLAFRNDGAPRRYRKYAYDGLS